MKIKELFDEEFKKLFLKKFARPIFRLVRIIIALIIISYFFQFAIVPSESMYPTMKVKDWLLIQTKVDEYEQGDIIAFKFPLNEEETYLKRIIGLPGDEVEVKDGVVFINEKPLQEDYLNEKPTYEYEKTKIPKDHYFVLGDNRNNSYDSSAWGFVEREKIRGKAVVVMMPISRIRLID